MRTDKHQVEVTVSAPWWRFTAESCDIPGEQQVCLVLKRKQDVVVVVLDGCLLTLTGLNTDMDKLESHDCHMTVNHSNHTESVLRDAPAPHLVADNMTWAWSRKTEGLNSNSRRKETWNK